MIELLLVVVIVAGVTAVAWPGFVRLEATLAVRTAARDLVGLAARARLEALSRREPVELEVGRDGVTLLRPQARFAEAETQHQEGQGGVVVFELPLSRKVALTRLQVLPARAQEWAADAGTNEETNEVDLAEGASITFYADGTSDDALIGVSRASREDSSSEYYVRLRGLVARADVFRTLTASDEELFSEVADATPNR